MCIRTCFFILFIVQIIFDYSHGQIHKKFFRKDYTYIEETQSFYKIHTLQKTWLDAKRTCSMEGSMLYYAEDKVEFDAVAKFWKEKQNFPSIYVGISDLIAKGVYETVDGVSVIDVYNNWEVGEPNDADGVEDCVTMGTADGLMNDVNCDRKFPFICKKTLASLTWNVECGIPNKDYVYNGYFGKCYKFGLTPKTWTDAYTLCSAEQSYLAVINSKEEADYLVTLAEKTPKKTKHNDSSAVFLGFHNRHMDGWTTIKGASLEDTGYSEWCQGKPDDGDEKLCGSMYSNGLLDNIKCNDKHYFICEHDVLATLNVRFGV